MKGTPVTVQYPHPDPRIEALRHIIAAAEAELVRLRLPADAWRTLDVIPSGSGTALGIGMSYVAEDMHAVLGLCWRTLREGRPSPAYQALRRCADRLLREHPEWDRRVAMMQACVARPDLLSRHERTWRKYEPHREKTPAYAAAERAAVAQYGLAHLADPRAAWAVARTVGQEEGTGPARDAAMRDLLTRYGAVIRTGEKMHDATKRARGARRLPDWKAIRAADRQQLREKPHVVSKLKRAKALADKFGWSVEAIRKRLPTVRRNRE
ncbi:hypothetical protein L6Q96_16145 [Candidatus Binatia bacterium]|nr:hypothetical protein [Candidatus Binatia bacterium]